MEVASMQDKRMEDVTDIPFFMVNTFSAVTYSGNSAGVCLDTTQYGLSEEQMQNISKEINLPETTFIQKLSPYDSFEASSEFRIRWFTPACEEAMCGHGTLAAAEVLFQTQGNTSGQLVFRTLVCGDVLARRDGPHIALDLPLHPPQPILTTDYDALIKIPLGEDEDVVDVKEVVYSELPYPTLIIRMPDSMTRLAFEAITPVPSDLPPSLWNPEAVIITKKGGPGDVDSHGKRYDYLCRYFDVRFKMEEHSVTGSAQTMLVPYWAHQLTKTELYCRQCSARGGDLTLSVIDDERVDALGSAAVLIRGHINVPGNKAAVDKGAAAGHAGAGHSTRIMG